MGVEWWGGGGGVGTRVREGEGRVYWVMVGGWRGVYWVMVLGSRGVIGGSKGWGGGVGRG